MFFQILESITEFDRALTSERTRDRLVAAQARGQVGGPKPKPRRAEPAREIDDQLGPDGKSKFTVIQITAQFGISRPTVDHDLDQAPTRADTASLQSGYA